MPNLKPSEILRAGLNLLETRGWTQEVYGRDASGDSVNKPKYATCFCGVGAIRAAAWNGFSLSLREWGDPNYMRARNLLTDVVKTPAGTCDFVNWQDEPKRTFPEVKAKFLEAIELAEQQEQAV